MPEIIHRHRFNHDQILKALMPTIPAGWDDIRFEMEDDELVIDISFGDAPEEEPGEVAGVAEETDQEGSPDAGSSDDGRSDAEGSESEPERKGGDLARAAGIMCTERSFQVYMDADDENHAAELLRNHCQVTSRADLDHDGDAARRFKGLKVDYEVWMRE